MSSEKTEKPTPRRLQKARESGDVPAVSSLPFSVALIGVLAVFTLKPSVLPGRFGNAISSAVSLNDADVIRHCTSVINEFFFELLIIPLTLLVFSSCARLLSSGPVFSTGILTGIWERINPGNYFQRIFSKEVFLTIIITSIAGIVFSTAGMWFLINPGIEMFNVRAFDSKTFVIILQLLIGAAWKCAACALVYGFLDSLFKRTTWEKRLMMTRRELIEEYRETEGDPLVKSRRKMLHRQLAMNSLKDGVGSAKVVVVNPTRFAVALGREDEGTPFVSYKGEGEVAAKMREEAELAGVPMVKNTTLAKSMYYTLEIEDEIEPEMFEAVAAVFTAAARALAQRVSMVEMEF